jgi:hypothetical protein
MLAEFPPMLATDMGDPFAKGNALCSCDHRPLQHIATILCETVGYRMLNMIFENHDYSVPIFRDANGIIQ